MYLKCLIILVIALATSSSVVQASWATTLANGLRHAATWGLPSIGFGSSLYYINYPDHYVAPLKKMGAIHGITTFDELYTTYKIDEFISLVDRNENTKPIYFFDKSIAEKQKPIILMRFGWLLKTTSFNDLVTKNSQSISAQEKAARLFMSIQYSLKSSQDETMRHYQRAIPLLSLAALQHAAQKYVLNTVSCCSWLKKPTTISQKIFAPLAIGALGIVNCYTQAQCIDHIKTLQLKKNVQLFVDQLGKVEKTLLPAYARMANEFDFTRVEQEILNKAVEEREAKN